MKKNTITVKKIAMTALLAALTVAGSYLRIKVPSVVGTSAFHLGNIMCALAGILLGPIYGGLAAGLGSAIYDMFDPVYISECWITFIMKGAYGVMAGLIAWSGGKKPWGADVRLCYLKALLASIAGAFTYAVLYLCKSCFYSGMLIKGIPFNALGAIVIEKLPATTFNAVVAIVAAPLLATAISKALKKAHIRLD